MKVETFTKTIEKKPTTTLGHVVIRTPHLEKMSEFYGRLGLSMVLQKAGITILELRGGTHLLLLKCEESAPKDLVSSFDLMVDDINAFQKNLFKAGIESSEVKTDEMSGHQMIVIKDPDGRQLSICSSHAEFKW